MPRVRDLPRDPTRRIPSKRNSAAVLADFGYSLRAVDHHVTYRPRPAKMVPILPVFRMF